MEYRNYIYVCYIYVWKLNNLHAPESGRATTKRKTIIPAISIKLLIITFSMHLLSLSENIIIIQLQCSIVSKKTRTKIEYI